MTEDESLERNADEAWRDYVDDEGSRRMHIVARFWWTDKETGLIEASGFVVSRVGGPFEVPSSGLLPGREYSLTLEAIE